MSAVDLIVLDLDGTLIGPSGTVSSTLWPALDSARDSGVRLAVCTGRPSGGVASRTAGRLDPSTPHIFHGGGVTRPVGADGTDGPPTATAAIATETVIDCVERARALTEARGRPVVLELYTPDAICVDELTSEAEDHARLLGVSTRACDLVALAERSAIVKMQWVVRGDDALASELERRPIASCHIARGTSPVMPDTSFLTITREDAHKGAAVRRLAASLRIDLARCAAIGDSTGDAPMLDVVGRPFVMAEAPASMRARHSTLPGVDADGVLEALRTLAI